MDDTTEPRSRAQRRADTERRLTQDVDLWVASAAADGAVEVLELDALPGAQGDRFAVRTGFDPRTLAGYRWFRIVPRRIQAWREVDELADRELMRGGRWLVETMETR